MNNQIEEKVPLEALKPFFLDDDFAAIVSPVILYRIDKRGFRFYYTINRMLEPTFYLSGTSFSNKVLPTSPHLIDWKARIGKEESEIAAMRAAQYGTFMHIFFGEFLRSGEIDFTDIEVKLLEYMEQEKIPLFYFQSMLSYIESDLLAFTQWCHDYKVRPIAIEFPIYSKEMKIGTLIDLVCKVEIEEKGFFGEVYKSGAKKGQPKETKQKRDVIAVVDFKSGRKGFFDAHELQLKANQKMWNDWYGDLGFEATHVFNWSPSEWRTEANYKFKNQTGSKQGQALPHYIALMNIFGWNNPHKRFKVITDNLVLGEDANSKFELKNLYSVIPEKHK